MLVALLRSEVEWFVRALGLSAALRFGIYVGQAVPTLNVANVP
jgi:hypothetical protein